MDRLLRVAFEKLSSLSIPSSDSAAIWMVASSSSRARSRIFSMSLSKTSTGVNRTREVAR